MLIIGLSILLFIFRVGLISFWITRFLYYEKRRREPEATLILIGIVIYATWTVFWLLYGLGLK